MSKHTPGPWTLETVPTSIGTCHKIGPFPSLGVREENHACVYADNVRPHDYGHSHVGDELLANARLIAAAPEMLDLLQHMAEVCPVPEFRDRIVAIVAKIEGGAS